MTRRRTHEDKVFYAVEEMAFEGTPLDDEFGYRSLQTETAELASGLGGLVPPTVDVVIARADMTRAGAYAKGGHTERGIIRFAPKLRLPRYLGAHELAHLVHQRSELRGRSHGPEYRACYVAVVSSAYGHRYGDLLAEALTEAGLDIHPASLPMLDTPIVPLDRLTEGVRWI